MSLCATDGAQTIPHKTGRSSPSASQDETAESGTQSPCTSDSDEADIVGRLSAADMATAHDDGATNGNIGPADQVGICVAFQTTTFFVCLTTECLAAGFRFFGLVSVSPELLLLGSALLRRRAK